MKSKAIIPLALGMVVGLAAIKFLVDAVQRAQGQSPELITTVVATTDIAASTAITREMVKLVETPRSPLVPEGGFTTSDEIVGRVTSNSIPRGSVIAPRSLAPPGTLPGLTERIDEGYRAVSVKIDEVSGVAGQLRPGDFVDVIVVMNVRRGRRNETMSRIILQKIKVIAVGQNLAAPAEGGAGKLARSVTLLVRDVDAPKLHLAQTQGKVTLAMRGADDRLTPEAGIVSTLDWEQPEEVASEPAPAEQVREAFASAAPLESNRPFSVTVVNGPLRGSDAAIQQVTYQNRRSMKVLAVEVSNTGGEQVSAPDGAGDPRRLPRGARYYEGDPRAGGGQWPGGYQQPPDREIDPE